MTGKIVSPSIVMKRKLVSPYIDNKRFIVGDPEWQGSYYGVFLEDCDKNSTPKWYYNLRSIAPSFDTKEEAMANLDEGLIKEGFTLLTQEQYDKLQILF